jgi:hypothetical protein
MIRGPGRHKVGPYPWDGDDMPEFIATTVRTLGRGTRSAGRVPTPEEITVPKPPASRWTHPVEWQDIADRTAPFGRPGAARHINRKGVTPHEHPRFTQTVP